MEQRILADADWKLMVAVVSSLIAAVSLSINVLNYRRQKGEGKLNLEVTVNPTRIGPFQAAQFRLYNRGKRPVNVQAWMVSYKAGNAQLSGDESLPRILKEQEHHDFVVTLMEDQRVEDIVALGINTKDNQNIFATKDNLDRFIKTAIEFQPKSAKTGA